MADVSDGFAQGQGGYYKRSDRSGPYAIDSNGVAWLIGLVTQVVGGTLPAILTAPAISGSAQVGQTLSVSNGTWSNSPTSFAYQWRRGGSAIAGAVAATYVPVQADLGALLTCTVTGTNASGSSPATTAPTVAVVDALPGQVTGVAVTGRTTTSVTLSWVAPSSGGTVTDYLMLYRVTGSPTWTTVDQNSVALAGTITGLSPGTSYDFAVEASDSGGISAISGIVTAGTYGVQPGQPTGLGISGQTANSLSLAWTAPASGGTPTDYQIGFKVTGSSTLSYADVGGTATTFTLAGLQPNTSYDVLVFATNTNPSPGPVSSTVTGSTSAAAGGTAGAAADLNDVLNTTFL